MVSSLHIRLHWQRSAWRLGNMWRSQRFLICVTKPWYQGGVKLLSTYLSHPCRSDVDGSSRGVPHRWPFLIHKRALLTLCGFEVTAASPPPPLPPTNSMVFHRWRDRNHECILTAQHLNLSPRTLLPKQLSMKLTNKLLGNGSGNFLILVRTEIFWNKNSKVGG